MPKDNSVSFSICSRLDQGRGRVIEYTVDDFCNDAITIYKLLSDFISKEYEDIDVSIHTFYSVLSVLLYKKCSKYLDDKLLMITREIYEKKFIKGSFGGSE